MKRQYYFTIELESSENCAGYVLARTHGSAWEKASRIARTMSDAMDSEIKTLTVREVWKDGTE